MFSLAKGTHLFCILRDREVNSKNSLHELDWILSVALSILINKMDLCAPNDRSCNLETIIIDNCIRDSLETHFSVKRNARRVLTFCIVHPILLFFILLEV